MTRIVYDIIGKNGKVKSSYNFSRDAFSSAKKGEKIGMRAAGAAEYMQTWTK